MKKANLKILLQKMKKHIKTDIPAETLLNVYVCSNFSYSVLFGFGIQICVNKGGFHYVLRPIKMVNCAKCSKEIPSGQEVKKGFPFKKSYHKECAPQ